MSDEQTTVDEAVTETVVTETAPEAPPKATKKRAAKPTDDEDRGDLIEVGNGISFYIRK